MEIRNIAIIAHVDHGKTTLTDALMHQSGITNATMDTNTLEQERGITIYSKNTSIFYKNTKINIVDTPGHSDFGSEVERVLRSIDSVLLLVDAQEGPMPQTKFVLTKSLELGLKPIVVLNKIDKPAQRFAEVEEMIFELFLDLGANDEQLDFTTLYAIARDGIARRQMDDSSEDLTPLLDVILEEVKPASDPALNELPLKIQPFNLAYDNFIGRLAIARVYQGTVKTRSPIFITKPDGETRTGQITNLFTFHGLNRKEVTRAQAGDIIMIAGLPDIYIGETISSTGKEEPMPAIAIDEPTISLNFLVNDSPFASRDGNKVTNRQIRDRLEKELEVNVGLNVDFSSNESYKVYGRGELHIAILLENMRREGFELQVSQPTVVMKEEGGQLLEPFEEVTIDIPGEMTGRIIETLAQRKGFLTDMKNENGYARLVFHIPVRGLLGYRTFFLTETRGEGILCSHSIGFRPYVGAIAKKQTGSMIAMATGKALGFALFNLQNRGSLYIGANTDVYKGQVIGNVAKGRDLTVNPLKGKQLTNMRASGSDEAIKLTKPMEVTIEGGLSIMQDDEYLEITPHHVRLRKKYLEESDRIRAKRRENKGNQNRKLQALLRDPS